MSPFQSRSAFARFSHCVGCWSRFDVHVERDQMDGFAEFEIPLHALPDRHDERLRRAFEQLGILGDDLVDGRDDALERSAVRDERSDLTLCVLAQKDRRDFLPTSDVPGCLRGAVMIPRPFD
jgi:hypothetical protein